MFDLKKFRKENKLTQDEVALYFGCEQSFISQIERGIRTLPESYISKIEADGRFTYVNDQPKEYSTIDIPHEEAADPKVSLKCASCEQSEARIMDLKEEVADKKREVEQLKGQITFLQHIIESQCLDRSLPRTGTAPP